MKALSESEIVAKYFVRQAQFAPNVERGIGDDAALLSVPVGSQLVTSVDTLLQGRHFFENVAPFDLGYKSLAVSVSDMAAMAAEPFAALLSLSLPVADPVWLQDFCNGFFALADAFSITLAGGDLTRGTLSVTTVVNGLVAKGAALYRCGASVGDLIYVSGTLGDAGLALALMNQGAAVDDFLASRLLRPIPRVVVARALRGLASSAMDISDGLWIDLTKLCRASGVAARLMADWLPLSGTLRQHCDLARCQQLALTAGDDYELLFTVPPALQQRVEELALDVPLTPIGTIVAGEGVKVLDNKGEPLVFEEIGHDHFSVDLA